MEITFILGGRDLRIETGELLDISIPLEFNGAQPNSYDADMASSKACEIGDFIGDTRRGGSCNFDELRLIPHCNGTHTECVGHISDERISIHETLIDVLIPSVLITVTPENAMSASDRYTPEKKESDYLITKDSISEALKGADNHYFEGLIIRTLPNDDLKKSRRYMKQQPPFFSLEAMEYVSELKVKHLLVDIPSVDRAFDKGKLSTHHIYWKVPQGNHDVDKVNHSMNTITEMIYVPNDIPDGWYMLNLQIPNFVSDAAPSRPFIFKILKNN
jgi:arylformamidase